MEKPLAAAAPREDSVEDESVQRTSLGALDARPNPWSFPIHSIAANSQLAVPVRVVDVALGGDFALLRSSNGIVFSYGVCSSG